MVMLRMLSALAHVANTTKEMTTTHRRRFMVGYSFYHSAAYCKASMLRPAMARKWGAAGGGSVVLSIRRENRRTTLPTTVAGSQNHSEPQNHLLSGNREWR